MMARQEGSPLFAESIANYDSRRTRGRQKLIIGGLTVCVALLLTMAIAIPLSVEPDVKPNSSIPLLHSEETEDTESGITEAEESNVFRQSANLQSQRKHRTKRPPPLWPTSTTEDQAGDDDRPLTRPTRPKWRTTTAAAAADDDPDDDSDPDGEVSWHPKKWRPWWTDHPDRTKLPWDPDVYPPPWYPEYFTKKPWWPWPTRRTTAAKTPIPTTTSAAAASTSPKKRTCQKIPEDVADLEIGDYANVWWYELARIQSSEVQIPYYLISCSRAFFRFEKTSGRYSSEGASATYLFNDNTGANQSAEIDLWKSKYPYRWLEISKEQEIKLNFVTRNDTYLLTYECLVSKDLSAGYAIRVWSLEQDGAMNSTALALLDLADSLKLNPDNLAPREFDQKHC